LSGTALPFEEVTNSTYSTTHLSGLKIEGTWKEAVLSGTCPRCGHGFQFIHPWRTYRSLFQRRPDGLLPVQIACVCDEDHPGRPADDEGCGAYWNVLLRREAQ
jgi:hypothetical protein